MNSQFCIEGGKHRASQERRVLALLAVQQEFQVYEELLERVKTFKYLGRQLSMTDDNAPAVCTQMAKARGVWARVSVVLKGENASPKVCRMFYREVVQSVLLYVSKSWVLNPAFLVWLKGFHVRAAWRMAREHRPRRGVYMVWDYPRLVGILEEVGLQSVE